MIASRWRQLGQVLLAAMLASPWAKMDIRLTHPPELLSASRGWHRMVSARLMPTWPSFRCRAPD
jgi:hypothetical protein